MFSDQELKKIIVPLFLEQLLVMFVGLADTLVISYAGESAVSGVSLINQFNTIFIYLFTALCDQPVYRQAGYRPCGRVRKPAFDVLFWFFRIAWGSGPAWE